MAVSAQLAGMVEKESHWSPPYYVKGLALGVPVYLVAIHIWTWILFVPGSLANGGYDFRQSYTAAYMVRTGEGRQLYNYELQKEFQNRLVSDKVVALPFVEPAYEALLLEPLSLVPFRSAYVLFAVVNLAVLAICFLLLRPWMSNLKAVYPWLPVALFLGFLPAAAALIEGQDSVLLTAALASAFVLLTKGHHLSAGLMAGLGFFKFPIVLPIALLFVIWRQWRFVMGLASCAAVLTGISLWVTGMTQSKLYIEVLLEIAGLKAPTSGLALYPVNWRMMANLHGLAIGLAGAWIPSSWLTATTMVIALAVLGWTAFLGRRFRNAAALLLLAVPCSIVVAHHTYIHDLSVLLIPVVILLDAFLPAEEVASRQRMIVWSAAVMFAAPVIESFSPNHFYLVALAVFAALAAVTQATPAELDRCVQRQMS